MTFAAAMAMPCSPADALRAIRSPSSEILLAIESCKMLLILLVKRFYNGLSPHDGINNDLKVSCLSLVCSRAATHLPVCFGQYQRSHLLDVAHASADLLARSRSCQPCRRPLSKCLRHDSVEGKWLACAQR